MGPRLAAQPAVHGGRPWRGWALAGTLPPWPPRGQHSPSQAPPLSTPPTCDLGQEEEKQL